MTQSKCRFRLTNAEREMLNEVKKRFEGKGDLAFQEHETCTVLHGLDKDAVIDLRELCSDYLTEVGFDKHYEPNAKGKLLETLVDKLFIG